MSTTNSLPDNLQESTPGNGRDLFTDEHDIESMAGFPSSTDSEAPVALDGYLLCRKGRSTGHSSILWKKRFVTLYFSHGGSIAIYKTGSEPSGRTTMLRTMYSRLQNSLSSQRLPRSNDSDLDICIPVHLPWLVKDVENDQATFVLEIATGPEDWGEISTLASIQEEVGDDDDGDEASDASSSSNNHIMHDNARLSREETEYCQGELFDELSRAKSKGKPMRVYFRCIKGSVEKALWLRAFSRLGRLSNESRRRKGLFVSLTSPLHMAKNGVRIRSQSNANFARDTRHLEMQESFDSEVTRVNDVEEMLRGRDTAEGKDKEYRVQPSYAYPHRWMNREELRQEMFLPSETFHDLRIPDCELKEIGSIRVEVLQCMGLPKLDRTAETDAIVYMCCGPYAFSTDVIPNRANPIWLRKTRRAAEFPLHHAYARLYVGVFDDDPNKSKDDFAGRVVIDISVLRPNSSYDITLPLRLSTHVYSRRKRGAIRLRLMLKWKSERDALLSYIPKKINIPLPQNSKPNTSITVACADAKAFRNICLTVLGVHMPRRFTFHAMKAAIREMNFTRKYIITTLLQEIRDTRHWVNPAISAFVFLSWMHCLMVDSFALVPAYILLYFFIQLMRSYAIYGMDGPAQRGFVPPSWEEMVAAVIRGGNPTYHAIEPMELGMRPLSLIRRKTPESLANSAEDLGHYDYRVWTHRPKGKALLRALGLLPQTENEYLSLDEFHREFPYANGHDYPKFSVRECLVNRKGSQGIPDSGAAGIAQNSDSFRMTTRNGEVRLVPRFTLGMEFPELMRKDSSGFLDYDEEEEGKFATRHAVVASGKKAASTLSSGAKEISELTGLNYVVSPLRYGLSSGMDHLREMQAATFLKRKDHKHMDIDEAFSLEADHGNVFLRRGSGDSELTDFHSLGMRPFDGESNSMASRNGKNHEQAVVDRVSQMPEQNIDVDGPSTGTKLTDDMADIKDRVHDMTWHLFDDKIYVVKHPDACFFGESKKPAKKWKGDVPRHLDKLLQIGQYSHSNPFVSRLGLYVEPIIGSAQSFLCLFRAAYNLWTWKDPMLTFWFSIVIGTAAVILFIFPWRIFLLALGIFLVGPQNLILRMLREKGHLPPLRSERPVRVENNGTNLTSVKGQPIFSSRQSRRGVPDKPSDIDPREVHHVVVPYSPLIYQRFYDWPPEPQYAQVKSEFPVDNETKQKTVQRRRMNGTSEIAEGLAQTARDFNLRREKRSGQRRNRANTGDWNPIPSDPAAGKKHQ